LDSDALVAYSVAYEFEDIFAAVTSAQRIDVTDLPDLEFSRRACKLARLASGSPRLDDCCFAWNKLINMPWKGISIGSREWRNR
jgi:hypothetical protein